jgi:DNA topoisomerase-3
VDAVFAADDARVYEGRYHDGSKPRLPTADAADKIVEAVRGREGEVTKVDTSRRKERAPLLYDLTTLQREANNRYGFAARRTLAAAQRLYEEHTALTYPRTNSRFLPSDLRGEIKPIAELVGRQPPYAQGARYVTGLDVLPLARVVNDKKVTDHHAIIPTRAEHDVSKFNADDKKIYDMVVRRFLAVFHPDAEFENTRVETTVSEHVFRTHGRVLLVPGWRAVYGETAEGDERPGREDEEDEGREQHLPKLEQGETVETRDVEALEKETQPPRRYSDASLLAAMETAGKLVDDEELREAMKDSGIGTPATRAAIIERLITVGYIERDGRALVCTEKGLNVIRLLGEHPLTSPSLTGDWEHRLAAIEEGDDSREKFMGDIEKFAEKTVTELDTKLKDVRIPRANLGPCPVCGRDINENRKGYSCWGRDDPGCGFVIWKGKAGKQLPVSVARELITRGRTVKPVTGFKSRAGRNFRARLALEQNDEGKWRVEFDEPWAKEGAAKPPDAETEEAAAEEVTAGETSAAA